MKQETSVIYIKDTPIKIEEKLKKGYNYISTKTTAKIIRKIFSDKFKWNRSDYTCSMTDNTEINIWVNPMAYLELELNDRIFLHSFNYYFKNEKKYDQFDNVTNLGNKLKFKQPNKIKLHFYSNVKIVIGTDNFEQLWGISVPTESTEKPKSILTKIKQLLKL